MPRSVGCGETSEARLKLPQQAQLHSGALAPNQANAQSTKAVAEKSAREKKKKKKKNKKTDRQTDRQAGRQAPSRGHCVAPTTRPRKKTVPGGRKRNSTVPAE
ncbi:hypothetical protein QG37_02918 [Candidozyma auris]|nr:hypothetical protein QG37_02918 [[Candida] auris]